MSDYKPNLLERTQFGNAILQVPAKRVEPADIKLPAIQNLIADIAHTLASKNYGVGLAAPQIGKSVAISVIDIQPNNKDRKPTKAFTQVIINPEVIEGIGEKLPMWEGCLSFGAKVSPVFAQTMRYKAIKVKFYDQNAELHEEVLEGLPAHVFQHETDHLNGILFPERVKDHSTWMNASEYRKMKKRLAAK